MGLLDDLNNEKNFATAKRAWCSMCELIKELPKNEATALKAQLDNKLATHTAISQVLKKNGYNISDGTVGRHRRNKCNGA